MDRQSIQGAADFSVTAPQEDCVESDTVSLTDLSKTIREVLASKDEPDPERMAFVQDLARRVRAGEYIVKLDKLAARLRRVV